MSLSPPVAVLLYAAVVAGHFGLFLTFYNRINALGLPRRLIKAVAKAAFVVCLALPVAAAVHVYPKTASGEAGTVIPAPSAFAWGWQVYGAVCLAAVPLLGIPWLLHRPCFEVDAIDAPRQAEWFDMTRLLPVSPAKTRKCRWAASIPGNQILQVSVDRIELSVRGLPQALDGYRIAQLSDLHFTGHIGGEMAAWAVERANRWNPDLFALTGDIVEYARCLDWPGKYLGHAAAADGCWFVLGNHDKRLRDPNQIREAMTQAGWLDVGGRCIDIELGAGRAGGAAAGGTVEARIAGNEQPWFAAPPDDAFTTRRFTILLAHSPDQFAWARRRRIELMLAGHTHGGQGRLPGIGPLLSPSLHGSRYASGDFYRSPTTMHVSRGLSGVHLLRINCRPELSLITLRTA